MALELLSGPNTIFDPRTGDPVLFPTELQGCVVFDGRGIVINMNALLGGRTVVQFDGASYRVGFPGALATPGGSIQGGAIPSLVLRGARQAYGAVVTDIAYTSNVYLYETVGIQEVEPVAGPNVLLIGASTTIAALSDRLLRPQFNTLFAVDYATSATTTEIVLPFNGAQFLSWGGQRSVWVGGNTGSLVEYDYDNKRVLGRAYTIGMAADGLFYSRKHGVFVSLHRNPSTQQCAVRVWARTVKPAAFSAITASPAAAAGFDSLLTVRLTGAHSDPAVGEVVDWSTTQGVLAVPNSLTDENGYATNRVALPVGSTGSAMVQVEVAV